MPERRNPYFVLGLDFGAGPAAAQAAFARLSRRLRRGPGDRYGIEDATWALHEIEHADPDPRLGLGTYRVPADPAAYDYPPAGGILSLAPRNLPRRTGSSEPAVTALGPALVHQPATAALAALADELAGGPAR
jgi:hypothetical protein